MTPEILDAYLKVLRSNNVMSASLECGPEKIAVTLAPDFPGEEPVDEDDVPRMPGGWKTEVSDPTDPDPLGLGRLDMAPAIDPADALNVEETEL